MCGCVFPFSNPVCEGFVFPMGYISLPHQPNVLHLYLNNLLLPCHLSSSVHLNSVSHFWWFLRSYSGPILAIVWNFIIIFITRTRKTPFLCIPLLRWWYPNWVPLIRLRHSPETPVEPFSTPSTLSLHHIPISCMQPVNSSFYRLKT